MSDIINAIKYKWPLTEVHIDYTDSAPIVTWLNGNIPTDAAIAEAVTEYEVQVAIVDEINRLEAEITPRRLRDAVLGQENPVNWLASQESLINTERSKL